MFNAIGLEWPSSFRLRHLEIVQIIWKLPEDIYQDHDEHTSKHNGQLQDGDSVTSGPGGKQFVKLKSEAIYKKQKQILQQAQLERVIKDGGDEATQATLGLQMGSLATDMEQGVGLGDCIVFIITAIAP